MKSYRYSHEEMRVYIISLLVVCLVGDLNAFQVKQDYLKSKSEFK